MKGYTLKFIIAILVAGSLDVVAQRNAGATTNYGRQGVEQLFNGKDLSGWYTYLERRGRNKDPKGVFKVENGVIRISGEEWGCITTNKEFENYHLIVEYKWGERTFAPRKQNARDGGVLIHSQGSDGAYDKKWMYSIECQIIEGGTGDILVVSDGSQNFSASSTVRTGSNVFELGGNNEVTVYSGRIDWRDRDPQWKDVTGFRGKKDVENALGEWNTLEVIANGDDVKIFLNNQFVNHAFNVVPRKGRIQIQSEGAEMYVRKVDLVPLPRDFRFMYNSDADNMFLNNETTPEKLYTHIDEIASTGVTTFLMSPNWGMPMNFPTKVGDMAGEHLSKEFQDRKDPLIASIQALVSAGHDPLGVILNRAKAHRLETFISFRLNEVHNVEEDDGILFDRFWREHPEWRIGKAGDALSPLLVDILGPRTHPIVGSWLPGGLNFAIPQVREYRMAQLKEVCERYDINGLEMDFQRFPMYFKPGEEAAGIEIMNQWMREVKAMVHDVARKKGHPILFTARIMALPEQNIGIGLDPVTWAREGVVDFIIASHYLHNNFVLPIDEYRKLLPEGFPVYASIEVEPTMKRYRQIAYPLWRKNVSGLSLFNFFTSRNSANPPPYDSIRILGYPVVTKDSLLLVADNHANTLSLIDPKSLQAVDRIQFETRPGGIAVMPDQGITYVATYKKPGNSISIIDLKAKKQIGEIKTGYYSHGHLRGATTSPDGRYVYFIMEYLNYILEIDTQTNKIARTIPTRGRGSVRILASPDGKYLLTANSTSGDISVINRSSGWLEKKIPVGDGVQAMAITPDRKSMWVSSETEAKITIVDMATLKSTASMTCAGAPADLLFTSDGQRCLVSGRTKDGTLTVIDVPGKKELQKIKVGTYANGLALSADERYVFVACGSETENNSAAVEDAHGVFVVDMKTLRVVTTLKVGSGPDSMTMSYPANK